MSQVAELLSDQSLFDNITDNNYQQFGELNDEEQILFEESEHNIVVLDARIKTIENYLAGLKQKCQKRNFSRPSCSHNCWIGVRRSGPNQTRSLCIP